MTCLVPCRRYLRAARLGISAQAVPSGNPSGELLKKLGAIPSVDTADFTSLPLFSQPQVTNQPKMPDLEPELQRVWQAISSESMPFDLIVQQSGLAAGSVSSALLQLELMGLVSQLPGMRYQRS